MSEDIETHSSEVPRVHGYILRCKPLSNKPPNNQYTERKEDIFQRLMLESDYLCFDKSDFNDDEIVF